MSKRTTIISLSIILVLFAANIFVQTFRKSGFHCDEIYTYGLSNYENAHYYDTHNADGSIKWNTAEDYKQYLAVSQETRFDYPQVLENQKNDVHPPLYYLIFHTVSSVFTGSYTKYIGAGINVLFSLGTCVLLYFLAARILKRRSLGVLAVLIYAFSANCINMTIYIRMYAALVFFCTAIFYLNIRIANNDYQMSVPEGILLGLCTFLGSLTHYYFFLFVAPVFVCMAFLMLKNKKFKQLLIYIVPFAAAALVYVLLWPTMFDHLFGSYRGEEAFSNAKNSDFYNNVSQNVDIVVFSAGVFTLMLGALSALIALVFRKFRIKAEHLVFTGVLAVAYFFIVTKVAPYQTDRYVSAIFPLLAVLIAYPIGCVINILASKLKKAKPAHIYAVIFAVTAVFVITDMALTFVPDVSAYEGKNYLYPVPEKTQKFMEENKGKKCLMINTHEAHFLMCLPDYSNYSETAFVNVNDLDKVLQDETFLGEDEIVVYINNALDAESILNGIVEKTAYTEYSAFPGETFLDENSRHWANACVLRK